MGIVDAILDQVYYVTCFDLVHLWVVLYFSLYLHFS